MSRAFFLFMTTTLMSGALAACGPETPASAEQAGAAEAVPPAAEPVSEFETKHQALMILDTHLDTPANLVRPGFNIMERHDTVKDGSQVDFPRMEEGGLDGGFWVVYTPQGPLDEASYRLTRDVAILRAVAVHEMVAANPDKFEFAANAADAKRIAGEGKKVVILSIENSYPLGTDVSLLDTFYKLGVRMVGPVHFRNNQFGDSGTDIEKVYDGLSPLGEQLVSRANELGMVLDGSHASDDVFDDLIRLSKTPIILSHSGSKAVYDHPRNIDDERLKVLAEKGGVIQVNAYGSYLKKLPSSPEREEAMGALMKEYQALETPTPEETASLMAKRSEINEKFPAPQASFEDFMDHLLHILKLIGPEHVGIGPDWDGGGGVTGLQDVSQYQAITQRLLDEGYSWDDLAMIMGGNSIRLLGEAGAYAASLKAVE